jgi:hypothetical protein
MPLVEINPRIQFRRGGPVEIGNVYQNRHGRPWFKVLFGKCEKFTAGKSRWNNCIMLHIDARGEVVGCSMAPEAYIQNHHDFVGKIVKMPELKMKWLPPDQQDLTSPSSAQSPASSRGKGRASASSKESEKS